MSESPIRIKSHDGERMAVAGAFITHGGIIFLIHADHDSTSESPLLLPPDKYSVRIDRRTHVNTVAPFKYTQHSFNPNGRVILCAAGKEAVAIVSAGGSLADLTAFAEISRFTRYSNR